MPRSGCLIRLNRDIGGDGYELQNCNGLLLFRVKDQQDFWNKQLFVGNPALRTGMHGFYFRGLPCADAARLLDRLGIAVRSGHHCAQPLLRRLGLDSALRASIAFYNTEEEIDVLSEAIDRISAMGGSLS